MFLHIYLRFDDKAAAEMPELGREIDLSGISLKMQSIKENIKRTDFIDLF